MPLVTCGKLNVANYQYFIAHFNEICIVKDISGTFRLISVFVQIWLKWAKNCTLEIENKTSILFMIWDYWLLSVANSNRTHFLNKLQDHDFTEMSKNLPISAYSSLRIPGSYNTCPIDRNLTSQQKMSLKCENFRLFGNPTINSPKYRVFGSQSRNKQEKLKMAPKIGAVGSPPTPMAQ